MIEKQIFEPGAVLAKNRNDDKELKSIPKEYKMMISKDEAGGSDLLHRNPETLRFCFFVILSWKDDFRGGAEIDNLFSEQSHQGA